MPIEIPRTIDQTKEIADKASRMNIILIGPPGSGKSTFVSELRVLSQNVLYISAGEITRKKILEGGEIAKQIADLYITGKAWPDNFVSSLMLPDLIQYKNRGFILDGIPRKRSEVDLLAKLLSENDIHIDMVVNIFSDYQTSLDRIERRMLHEGKRPENIDHYKVRLDMYWSALDSMREVLGSLSDFVDFNSDTSNPAGILNAFLDGVERNSFY